MDSSDSDTADTSARHPSSALLTVLALATGANGCQPLLCAAARQCHWACARHRAKPRRLGRQRHSDRVWIGALLSWSRLPTSSENRALVLILLGITACGLAGSALAGSAPLFFAASLVVGVCSSGAQVLLPFTAQLVPVERRGRVVGNVMAGVLTGIMLARPLSLFIAWTFGWRTVFWLSACLMVVIAGSLAATMPRYAPRGGMAVRAGPHIDGEARPRSAGGALAGRLPGPHVRGLQHVLDRGPRSCSPRSSVWISAPIALFALAGAGGAFAAPFAGRLADRGLGNVTTAAAMAALGLCFAATVAAAQTGELAVLAILAIIIDGAVQTNQVVSQRTIFAVPAEVRGRVNAVFMTISFIGGAIGSMLGTLTFHAGGWIFTAAMGALVGAVSLGLLAVQMFGQRRMRTEAS